MLNPEGCPPLPLWASTSAIYHVCGTAVPSPHHSARIVMRLARFALFASSLVGLAGCNGSNEGTVDPGVYSSDPATATYAPALNVSLPTMTKSATGLYVKDLVVGTGTVASAGYTARVSYTGWLINGVKFDTSEGKLPGYFEFLMNAGQVINGWEEGVRGMKAGGKRQLVVPPELGYGTSGSGAIPGNAILVFEISLIQVR